MLRPGAELKRQASDAAARGRPVTDLDLHFPADTADAGERYLAALDEADRYAPRPVCSPWLRPLSHRLLRQWYVRSIIDQLRAAGTR